MDVSNESTLSTIDYDEILKVLKTDTKEISNFIGKDVEEIFVIRGNKERRYKVIRKNAEAVLLKSKEYEDPCIIISPIKIENKNVKKEIICNDWIFGETISLQGSIFAKYVSFDNSDFYKINNFVTACFLSHVSFKDSTFYDFPHFSLCHFKKNVDFSYSRFINDAGFHNSTFSGSTSFIRSYFSNADFSDTVFIGPVSFTGMRLIGLIRLQNTSFKDITNIDFDVLSDIKKKPIHLISSDCKETKENFHVLKKIYHNNEQYEEEDIVYYWYKQYERKTRMDEYQKRLKKGKTKYFFPFLWVMIKTFFNLLILDKCSKYFTSPQRVFFLMLFVLILCFGIFSGVNYWENEQWGYLMTSEETVFETVEVDGNFVTTQTTDPVSLKKSCTYDEKLDYRDFFRDNAYFSLITFTTIGYGDIHPTGWLRIIAGIEGFLGILLMSLFLLTSAKKVLW